MTQWRRRRKSTTTTTTTATATAATALLFVGVPQNQARAAMWSSHFRGVDMSLGDGREFFEAQVAGVSPSLPQRIKRLAEQEVRCALPLYILNYIWYVPSCTNKQTYIYICAYIFGVYVQGIRLRPTYKILRAMFFVASIHPFFLHFLLLYIYVYITYEHTNMCVRNPE